MFSTNIGGLISSGTYLNRLLRDFMKAFSYKALLAKDPRPFDARKVRIISFSSISKVFLVIRDSLSFPSLIVF
jgi:hypothetical protein